MCEYLLGSFYLLVPADGCFETAIVGVQDSTIEQPAESKKISM